MEQTNICVKTHSFSAKSLSDFPLCLETLLRVKKVTAKANFKSRQISQSVCEAIIFAVEQILASPDRLAGFIVDPFQGGGGIAVNQNLNECIESTAAELGAEISIADINRSQSTADVLHTSLRISLYTTVAKVCPELQKLIERMEELEAELSEVEMVARTCLRDAEVGTFGDLFQGYTALLNRRNAEIVRASENLTLVNLSGTATGSRAGTTLEYQNCVIGLLNEEFQMPLSLRASLYDAAQNSDDLAQLSMASALLASSLIKCSNDLKILFSGPVSGFGELEFNKTIKGSSFYFDKQNPTLFETIIQGGWLIQGNDFVIQKGLEASELSLNSYEPMMGFLLHDSLSSLTNICRIFAEHGLDGAKANKVICAEHVLAFRQSQNREIK